MNIYTFECDKLKVTTPFLGDKYYRKVSYPIKVGLFTLVETREARLFFDLNGEIKFIHGLTPNWPHPNEFIKRTKTNDFIYYSSGEYYGGIYDATGEYYVPCFMYPSNNLWKKDIKKVIDMGKSLWKKTMGNLRKISIYEIPSNMRTRIEKIRYIDERYLEKRAAQLQGIYKTHISVLPPDTRHVDYDVIPIIISDGCLYHCKFCRVKSKDKFSERSKKDILEQIISLKEFYKDDIKNYSSIYLGLHDSLNCSFETIKFAIENAREILCLDSSYVRDKSIFIFASVHSFLNTKDFVFEYLNTISDTKVYINIGLESVDDKTLNILGKPIDSLSVKQSFEKMVYINKNYLNIEVTANFILDLSFSREHFESLIHLIRDSVKKPYYKGTIYLSPLKNNDKMALLKKVMELKRQSFLPMCLYIIQRF
ncbi:hypothetical protein JCM13304A_15040 [Desulfothermus okinawensis JCM 13304]